MNAPLVKIKHIFNSVVAVSLTVWLSGLICVFGCETAVAKKDSKPETQAHSMPANHSCSKKAKSKKEIKPVKECPKPSTNESNCPFFIHNPTEQARKANTEAAPALLVINNFSFVQISEKFQPSISYRARLPDRGGTHLQNCVFLI
jgi:hypothetical protein